MIKHNLVKPDMIKKALDLESFEDAHITKDDNHLFESIADQINKMIFENCLYCDYGKSSCQCWNDE
jgi:hypothetical protein